MIISNVNIGSGPGANDGESIYSAFYKVNQNFANVQSNVNSLTNSVSSVAGRTGNVTLTIADVVGLATTYASQANIITANIGMKGYVDAKIAANVAALVDSSPAVLDTLNELAAALNDDASFSTTIVNTITLANTIQSQQIAAANIGIVGYVDLANTIQSAQVGAANLAIIAANLGMKGYVDSVASQSIYGNVNVQAYTESMGFQNFGNVNVAAYVTTANSAILGYIDLANTIQSAQVNAANLAITAANVGMKGYVDSVASQSIYGNANVASYLHANDYSPYSNVNVAVFTNLSTYAYSANVTAANLGMKGYVDSVASQSIYGNGNVKSYLTEFDGNIVPSANVTYSLGSDTNRWKDLYLSGNTIFLGDSTISTEGGRLVTTGVAISPPTGAVGFANVQFEAATNFDQIRSYYVDNNFGYTANLTSWTTAPIVWDELRSAKIKINSSIVTGYTADFESLDTSGGRFANALATLDATGNIASLTITDGGVGYDAYYPYYGTDPTGYDNNYIGQPFNSGSPTGKSFRRIGLIPTNANNVGNITSISSFTRYSDLPTVGSNSYTWTGNTGTTISFTVDWSSNTITSYTYTPALPALTSAQDWQNWILDYQSTNDYGWIIGSGSITGGGGTPIQAVYDYLSREALPNSLTYDESATTWYPGNLLVNNSATIATLSSSTFFVTFNRTSINYATLENSYGNPVYWSRGLSADTGISSGGDMTVAGDLRVAGDLYVSPTSIYMGDLRISAADGNLKVNTGIKFSDNSVQSTAWLGSAAEIDVTDTNGLTTVYYPTFVENRTTGQTARADVNLTYRTDDNILGVGNIAIGATGNIKFADGTVQTTAYTGGGSYGNAEVATYLPTYTGNVSAGNVLAITSLRFSTGNVKITNDNNRLNLIPDTDADALSGVVIGGSGYILAPNGARNITLNYGGGSGVVGLQANVTIGTAATSTLTVNGNTVTGNVSVPGTSGKIGFSSGGFAQQATSNATQVTSHFTSGNIQLMSIDLGASAVHTVTFACNKLTTNDLLLIKHVSGGVTSVYVDAYVVADGLAVIWMRDITGVGTGAFTAMLKYAIIQAPSS